MKDKHMVIKIVATGSYFFMLLLNILANLVPINGVTTGEVSDAYPDLVAPATTTFLIWGVIYVLLILYTLYQWGFLQTSPGAAREKLFVGLGPYFSAAALANGFWILAWHYEAIGLSLLLVAVNLYALVRTAQVLRQENLGYKDWALIKLPFSIFYGWVTVAAIANLTTFLVSIGFNALGALGQAWAVLAILIGAGIGAFRLTRDEDIFYGLVFIWAFAGIIGKHVSPDQFAGQYPVVIAAGITGIVIVSAAAVLLLAPRLDKGFSRQ